jgi:hypothetical protein
LYFCHWNKFLVSSWWLWILSSHLQLPPTCTTHRDCTHMVLFNDPKVSVIIPERVIRNRKITLHVFQKMCSLYVPGSTVRQHSFVFILPTSRIRPWLCYLILLREIWGSMVVKMSIFFSYIITLCVRTYKSMHCYYLDDHHRHKSFFSCLVLSG